MSEKKIVVKITDVLNKGWGFKKEPADRLEIYESGAVDENGDAWTLERLGFLPDPHDYWGEDTLSNIENKASNARECADIANKRFLHLLSILRGKGIMLPADLCALLISE